MRKDLIRQFQALRQLSGGFRASRVIFTANNYEIFDKLKTATTAVALSRKLKTDPRATEILLDAVTALGLLRKKASTYCNTPLASTFLVRSSPWYQGDMIRHSDHLWKNWSGLDDVVRTGRPHRVEGRNYEVFIRAMHNNAVLRAASVVDAIGLNNVRTVLDLGGGPGTYSAEFADQGMATTLFDMPEALKVARTIVRKSDIAFKPGDFHVDDIGSGYDLVFVSQVLHSLSAEESLALLKKIHAALNAKGRIAIHEFLLEKDRAHPAAGALFSINMLINTAAGRSYTRQEMRSWLVKAGFKSITVKKLGETVLVMGKK